MTAPDPILLTPLRRIPTGRGDVLHGMKRTDPGYAGFGEAYFSTVDAGLEKGWKRHREMVLNLVVVSGTVEFTLWDDRADGEPAVRTVRLSPDQADTYQRLTVPPGVWVKFVGLDDRRPNMLINLASLLHDPKEADNLDCATHATPADR